MPVAHRSSAVAGAMRLGGGAASGAGVVPGGESIGETSRSAPMRVSLESILPEKTPKDRDVPSPRTDASFGRSIARARRFEEFDASRFQRSGEPFGPPAHL